MVKIFCDAYDIVKENGRYHINHTPVLVATPNCDVTVTTTINSGTIIFDGTTLRPMERVTV